MPTTIPKHPRIDLDEDVDDLDGNVFNQDDRNINDFKSSQTSWTSSARIQFLPLLQRLL